MIAFNQPSLANQKFSSEHSTLFTYQGYNHGVSTTVSSAKPSCGCVIINYPEKIENGFTITLLVDKKGMSGYTAVSAEIKFANGEKVTLYASGKIEST